MHARTRSATFFSSVTCALISCALSACTGNGDAGASTRESGGGKASSPSPTDQSAAPITTGVLGPDVGLEVQIWATDAPDAAVAQALGSFVTEPLPFPPQAVATWRANGLRIVAVPLEALPAVQRQFQSNSGALAFDRQWLGQVNRWTPVFRGAPANAERVLALDSGRVPLPAGRFRLLLRGWIGPDWPAARLDRGPPRGVFNVEILPQYQESARTLASESLALDAPSLDELDQGQLFDRLALSGTMSGSRAILIVSDRPDSDWATLRDSEPSIADAPVTANSGPDSLSGSGDVALDGNGSGGTGTTTSGVGRVIRPGSVDNTSTRATSGGGSAITPAGPRPTPQGPSASVLPTLGTAMLAGAWSGSARSAVPAPALGDQTEPTAAAPPVPSTSPNRRRVLVVLIPRVPDHFTLLGQ